MYPRERFFDDKGRILTTSLFLETNYDADVALYTLKDYDHEYQGKIYPSLGKAYIEMEDPTEYAFTKKYLGSWQQWQRMLKNKALMVYIQQWREELEVHLRSQAIRNMIDMACSEDGNFSAAKYLAEYSWEKRKAGRPSKEEVSRHLAAEERIHNEFEADIARLDDFRQRKTNG
jgi:hypothetical protein